MANIPFVRVQYVDGSELLVPATEWSQVRSEGVDSIAIGYENFTNLSGQSVYWVYPERDEWIMGGGPVGYGHLAPEVIVGPEDDHRTRSISFMPDLPHEAVKLGHWWPGEPRRPIDA